MVRCCECDRPLAVYGPDEGEDEICAGCDEQLEQQAAADPKAAIAAQRDREATEAALRG